MTSEAQPGQEQRMVTDAMIEAGAIALQHSVDLNRHTPDRVNEAVADCYAAMVAARPTVDLGEDGEFATRLRNWQGDMPDALKHDLAKAADRLILYREALEVLLLVKDAVDYRGDACHPAEMVGAVLDKCILERIDAVLSRSGG